jgi:DNA-binding transcriptional LysR family regulator
MFTKTAKATATALGLNLLPVVRAETFSLLMSAVESGTAAAFLPEVAAKTLPEERFAQVQAKGMEAMDRSLSLVWNGKVAESRASIRRALTRMRRVLGTEPCHTGVPEEGRLITSSHAHSWSTTGRN